MCGGVIVGVLRNSNNKLLLFGCGYSLSCLSVRTLVPGFVSYSKCSIHSLHTNNRSKTQGPGGVVLGKFPENYRCSIFLLRHGELLYKYMLPFVQSFFSE